MSDVWADHLLDASFGGIDLFVVTGQDSIDRALVRHSIPRAEGSRQQDMGSEARETRCTVLFIEETGQISNHIERYERFVEKCNDGDPHEFVHPITGSYPARVEGFRGDWSAGERDLITVECTFVEELEDELLAPDITIFPSFSLPELEVTVAELNAAFEAATIDSSIAFDALDMALGWDSNPLLTVRQINTQLEAFTSTVANLETSLELQADLALYPVMRAINLLMRNVRTVAEYFKRNEPALIEVEVRSDVPLLVFVTDLYGASQASARYDEAQRLNDIDDPSLLRAGTVLIMPSPSFGGQERLRGAA